MAIILDGTVVKLSKAHSIAHVLTHLEEITMSVVARIAFLVNLFVLITLSAVALADSADQEVTKLRQAWATAKYQTPKNNQTSVYESLIKQAKQANEKYPRNPKVMIWYGTILSSYAAHKGGMAVLPDVKLAKQLLEEAIQMDPNVENGFGQGVLGALYARVPSWPIAFGSKQKARRYLEKAVEIDPKGIDSNYYYGDFLVDIGEFQNGKSHLETAKNAPARAGYEVQDKGRQTEIAASLAKINRGGK